MRSSLSISQNAKNRAVIRRPMTKSTSLRKSAPTCAVITKTYVKSAQSSGKSTSYLNTRSTSSILNPTYMNDSTLIELKDRLYENPDFDSIDNETLQKLQAYLREYKQDRALSEDYDNAEKASFLFEQVKIYLSKKSNDSNNNQKKLESTMSNEENNEFQIDKDTNNDINTNSNLNIDLTKDDEKKRLQEFEQKWKGKFEKFDQTTEQKIEELEKKQSKQSDDFEKIWSTEKPSKYRKPSSKLLELKKMERTLALTGDFDQARLIHAEAERLASDEQKKLQSALIRDYRLAKASFQSKQIQEKQKFLQIRLDIRSRMEIQKNDEYIKFVKRSAVVQDKYKESQRTSRERSGQIKPDYGVSVSNFNQNKVKFTDNIIPPLFAPNDPSFVEEDERKARERKRKQLELQKKNAEITLLEYTVQPSPRNKNNDEETNINWQNKYDKEDNNDESNSNCQIKYDKEDNNEETNSNDIPNQPNNNIIINDERKEKLIDIIEPVINSNYSDNNKTEENNENTKANITNNMDNDDINTDNENNENTKTDITNNIINDSIITNNENNEIDKKEEMVGQNNNDQGLGQLTSAFSSILNNLDMNNNNDTAFEENK